MIMKEKPLATRIKMMRIVKLFCLKIDNSPRSAYPIICRAAAMAGEFYCE
jgi:hypothetical protein